MTKYFALLIVLMSACSGTAGLHKMEAKVDAAPLQQSFKSVVQGINNSYFEIKDNNYFDFYQLLFDSVKNTSYPGKYTKNGDTLFLNFYQKGAEIFLGNKALINENKKEIVFFDNLLGVKRKLIFN